MIKVENLTKKFGAKTVLADISFRVGRGEILGLLGPNGAGKTTTMKIITGYWQPTAGRVLVHDADVANQTLATKQKIGYLPENVPLYDEMKVYEYLRFVALIRQIEGDKIVNRIAEVINSCGLQQVVGEFVGNLSKGYRQRLGLAQAIIHNPEILILDEPTTGLDPNQIVEIRELIKTIGQEKTIIFSTHILAEAAATCDRIIIINHGQIVGEGKVDELTAAVGRQEVHVKIKGPRANILEQLLNLDEVAKVEIADQHEEDMDTYVIVPEKNAQVQEKLFHLAVEQGWVILELTAKAGDLEDVFRQLTK